MALLGVSFPSLRGIQCAIDLFPASVQSKKKRSLGSPQFQEFLLLRLPRLIEQRYLWECFQRLLQVSDINCWDRELRDELLGVSYEDFSRPRNTFIYSARFWPPLNDLMIDADGSGMTRLFGADLDIEDNGFLLRLSFLVYRLFENLIIDLAGDSQIVRIQLEASRCVVDPELPELGAYRNFISQVNDRKILGTTQ